MVCQRMKQHKEKSIENQEGGSKFECGVNRNSPRIEKYGDLDLIEFFVLLKIQDFLCFLNLESIDTDSSYNNFNFNFNLIVMVMVNHMFVNYYSFTLELSVIINLDN